MRKLAAVAALAAVSMTLAACSGGGTADTKPEGGAAPATDLTAVDATSATEVNVMTWWEAGSEKLGLEALVGVFNTQFPNTEFKNAAVAGGGGSQAKQKLAADLAAHNPPDTFQAHAGAELNDYIEAGQIADVSALYDEFGLRDAFPATLLDRLTVDGKIFSVPSNVHRANVVWANPAVLKEAGLDPAKAPADVDAWIADMEKIKAAGKTPITVGMAWTQLHLLETILVADLGAEKYTGLWDGSTDWASAEVTTALGHFEKIMSLSDAALHNEDWQPALQPVIDGTAAYNVMGDWALSAYDEAGKKAGTDYIYFPVPGTDGIFDFLADSFTLPVDTKNVAGAKAWMKTISSPEGQVAFNTVKGSIPARSDLTAEQIGMFSEYQQNAIKSFGSDTIVSSVAHGAATSVTVSSSILDALKKFTEGASDLAGFQAELVKATEGLKK